MDTKKATLRYFGSSTVEVCILSTAVARNVETSVEEEITVQHPQPVVARLFNEMEEELLADV